jgi:hypothetical protein
MAVQLLLSSKNATSGLYGRGMRQGGRHEHPETVAQKRWALRTKPHPADWYAIGAQADQTQTRPSQSQNETTYAKTQQTEEP